MPELLMQKERKQVADALRRIAREALTCGTGGNISIYNREEGKVCISPTSYPYEKMTPEDVVVVDAASGEILDGKLKPSSELGMHLINYRNRDDLSAFVHSHPIYCGVVSATRKPLPAIHYMIAIAGTHEIKCAEYAMYGTPELASNAYEAMRGAKACLLANHGLNVGADSLENAIAITEYIEFVAEIYVKAQTLKDGYVLFTKDQIAQHIEAFGSYCKL